MTQQMIQQPPSLGRVPAMQAQPGFALSLDHIDAFLNHLNGKGCRKNSLDKYRHDLTLLHSMLPEGKQVGCGTLVWWRTTLLQHGYAVRTINSYISEANGLLAFLGRREFQLPGALKISEDESQPELKRAEYLRLLSAARAEFARTSYAEASVNRIIQAAGIPRGSFYMYFADKEELFRYLMERYGDMLVERFASLLDLEGGDLFAAFLDLYDEIASRLGGGPCRELAEIIRRNRQMQPGALLAQPGPEAVLDRLRSRLDLSRLDLRSQEDLTNLFHLLVFCLAGALRAVEREGIAAARDHLARALDLLRRGAAAKERSAGANL